MLEKKKDTLVAKRGRNRMKKSFLNFFQLIDGI